MRTTVDLDDALLKRAKAAAVQTGRTLTSVIEDALRESLSRARPRVGKKKARFTVYGAGGAAGSIDFNDNASVRAAMDEGLPIEKLR